MYFAIDTGGVPCMRVVAVEGKSARCNSAIVLHRRSALGRTWNFEMDH